MVLYNTEGSSNLIRQDHTRSGTISYDATFQKAHHQYDRQLPLSNTSWGSIAGQSYSSDVQWRPTTCNFPPLFPIVTLTIYTPCQHQFRWWDPPCLHNQSPHQFTVEQYHQCFRQQFQFWLKFQSLSDMPKSWSFPAHAWFPTTLIPSRWPRIQQSLSCGS